jgi:hypothetical protein
MTTRKIVLTFGLVAGAILAAMMALMVPLSANRTIDFDNSEIIGYTTMVLAFLMVVLGIRSYRDNVGGGAISFATAFKVGILITLIASAVYVISWEIIYFQFVPDFADKYAAHAIEKMRAAGATEAVLAAESQKMADFKRLYANPLFNVGVTFLEVFPIGLIVTLVAAAVLRRKVGRTPGASTA